MREGPRSSTRPHWLPLRPALSSAMLISQRPAAHASTGAKASSHAAASFWGGMRVEESADRRSDAKAEAALDRLLIRRFNRGDTAAFDEIVERYRGRIQALAERFLHNHADAEEIAQDTFVRAFRGLARFRGESSLATWLHRIAVNLARNRYWYFFRRRKHLILSLDCPLGGEGGDSNGTFTDLVANDEVGPVQSASTGEFVGLVATCMEQLEIGHREILTLRNELNHSYDEIARELGINPGTVKSRIARARGKLRDLMAGACPEFAPDAAAREWFEPVARRHVGVLNAS